MFVKSELGQVVCHFDGEVYGDTDKNHGIMAVGMIVKRRHEHPSRIVLRLLKDKFAIHEQVWKDRYLLPPDRTLQIKPDSPSYFITGDYFDVADIGKAINQFLNRQREHLDRILEKQREDLDRILAMPKLCETCQAEIDDDGNCPVCDPWEEDQWEDDF